MCAGPGRPLHTYKQRENGLLDTVFKANVSRERAKKHDIQLIGRPFQVFLPKFSCFKGPFACIIKVKANNMCVTGSDKLLKGNQIDWVIQWVSWFQVFSKEIKSNAVSKLFILVWHFEGMKVLDLGYENSYENFSITPICHIFSNFPAVFRYAQVTNRQVWNMDLTHLGRTHHMQYDVVRVERMSIYSVDPNSKFSNKEIF